MQCPYCGANIEADISNRKIVFCTYCGSKIHIEDDSKDISININQNINQRVTNDADILKEQNRHRENKWKLILSCVVIALLIGALSLFGLNRNNKTKDTAADIKDNDSIVNANEEIFTESDGFENDDNQVANDKDVSSPIEENTSQNEGENNSNTGKQQLELIDSGYSIVTDFFSTTIEFAVKIHNPNTDYAVLFPEVLVTVKSSDGKILDTYDTLAYGIAAGETIALGDSFLYEGDIPDTVEISIKDTDDYSYVLQNGEDLIHQDQLVFSNISEFGKGYDRTITGEITNNSAQDLSSVSIIAVLNKDGKIVGCAKDIVTSLKSGKTMPFEINILSNLEYDSYELYGLQ